MNYLSIEQSISILPPEFKNIEKYPGRRPIYSSSMGNLAQAESTVHMLNWAIRSVKFLGVEFD